MNESKELRTMIDELNNEAVYPDEIYVMNYLRILGQKILLIDHPLSVQYHIPPQEAFKELINRARLVDLAIQLGCPSSETFSRLRTLLDQWDGVALPESFEAGELNENDAFTLVLDDNALAIAGKMLNCASIAVLGYLFDPMIIERDFRRALPAAIKVQGVYARLQYLSQSPDGLNLLKKTLGIGYTWEILESWLKIEVRTQLASLFNQPNREVTRGQVLQELFRQVKAAMGGKTFHAERWQNSLRMTTFGQLMPSRSKKFWEDLKHVSSQTTRRIALDALDEANLDVKHSEANAAKALEIAQQFISDQITPLEKELARVDIFGMMALNHRFYGILDELLGNALHYASLDADSSSLVNIIQHTIRFYGYGEYQLALSRLLLPEKLPLKELNLSVNQNQLDLSAPDDTKLLYFSADDNPSRLPDLRTLFNRPKNPLPQPPRTIEKGELLIALFDQDNGRTVEVISFKNLTSEQITHLKEKGVDRVAKLSTIGENVCERLLNTNHPVLPERKRLNDNLRSSLAEITRTTVFTGEHLPDYGLFSSPYLFGKTIDDINSSTTFILTTTIQAMCDQTAEKYTKNGVPTHREIGF